MSARRCPRCQGRGGERALVYGIRDGRGFDEWRRLPCQSCDGTGELDQVAQRAYTAGRKLGLDRKRRGLTLTQEAARLGISPQELSHREWGRG